MDRKTLLVIDDSEIDREILKEILSNDFYVIAVDNGYSGLEIILDGLSIDAILLDISMPVLNGFNVLHLMNEKHINIPVFLITSEGTRENVYKAIGYSVSDFIVKPFNTKIILSRLKAKLDIKQ